MAQLKVIKASAGSGKTFNLTSEYLRYLFSDNDAFMHILAVTFTNKATEEMKTRIIQELYSLAMGKPTPQLNRLMEATGYAEGFIRTKSHSILKKILHSYSQFFVSTIDSFFQRIIRSFTRELGIQEGYAIELDTESVLVEAIDQLLIQAENDPELILWLTQFAESLIEKGENWNLRKGIYALGMHIFNESFKGLNDTEFALFSDRKFLLDYKKELHSIKSNIEKTYSDFGHQASGILLAHDLHIDDFSGKKNSAAGFLISLLKSPFRAPTLTALSAANSVEKWYTRTSPQISKITDVVSRELMPLLQKVISYYEAHYRMYYSATVILKNLFTLGILADLSRLTDKWCSENNAFLLTEGPNFLNKIIGGNDTPFIYEKAGVWFHNYMIDEFQDTSLLQWLNFKPLISNSLSQEYDNLAVGDAKQSIYRWRNSNWEILETQISAEFSPGTIDAVTLKENWRSMVEIIEFNNTYFKAAAELLQQEIEPIIKDVVPGFQNYRSIPDLYCEMEQIPGKSTQTGGYVRYDYLDSGDLSDYFDQANAKVLNILYELLEKGFQLSDISILTRKNNESKLLADYLISHAQDKESVRIDVISDEALRLGSSIVVNTIVSLLQYINRPYDETNLYLLKSIFTSYLEPINTQTDKDVLPNDFKILAASPDAFSLIEIVERIIHIFQLVTYTGEQVYVMAFKDLVMEFGTKNGNDIPSFIDYWNDKGKEKSVSAPTGQDAVRILTIHKAKGLEFPVTIIPYCIWDMIRYSSTILWCRPQKAPFNKLPVLPVSFSKELRNTDFVLDFHRESYLQMIDNLNLLYVAFTRAQQALFIIGKKVKEGDAIKNVSDLSDRILGSENYSRGILLPSVQKNQSHSEMINFANIGTSDPANRIKIAFQGTLAIDAKENTPYRPINEGRILHEIFMQIRYRSDIPHAIKRIQIQGKINQEDSLKYTRYIEDAFNDIQVSSWFTADWNIMTEAEIIIPQGIIKRPDRVITNSRSTLVIDYKFGMKIDKAYESQVKEYAMLLQDMGYQGIEAYIWYVSLKKVITCSIS